MINLFDFCLINADPAANSANKLQMINQFIDHSIGCVQDFNKAEQEEDAAHSLMVVWFPKSYLHLHFHMLVLNEVL